MKVLGINGSHRAGKGTAALLQAALDGAAEQGTALGVPVGSELVELSRLDIEFCIGCNRCLAQTSCTLKDDMNDLYEKLRDADVILLATAGLNNCGGEGTLALLDSWFATQGMLAVHPRTQGAPLAGGVVATGFAGLDGAGQPQWRSVKADEIGFALAHQLGREAASLAARLR